MGSPYRPALPARIWLLYYRTWLTARKLNENERKKRKQRESKKQGKDRLEHEIKDQKLEKELQTTESNKRKERVNVWAKHWK